MHLRFGCALLSCISSCSYVFICCTCSFLCLPCCAAGLGGPSKWGLSQLACREKGPGWLKHIDEGRGYLVVSALRAITCGGWQGSEMHSRHLTGTAAVQQHSYVKSALEQTPCPTLISVCCCAYLYWVEPQILPSHSPLIHLIQLLTS